MLKLSVKMIAFGNTTGYDAVTLGMKYIDIWLNNVKLLPNSIKYTSILLNTIAIISHSVGLYLLSTAKRNEAQSNNNRNNMVSYTNFKLLIMLSVGELLSGLLHIIVVASLGRNHPLVTIIVGNLQSASSTMGLSTIFLITLNRVLSISYPLWYRSSVTKNKFIGVVVLTSLAFVCPTAGFQCLSFWYKEFGYVFGTIGNILYCFYFFFCIFSYVFIAKMILKSRRNVQISNVDENFGTNNCVHFVYTAVRKQGYRSISHNIFIPSVHYCSVHGNVGVRTSLGSEILCYSLVHRIRIE